MIPTSLCQYSPRQESTCDKLIRLASEWSTAAAHGTCTALLSFADAYIAPVVHRAIAAWSWREADSLRALRKITVANILTLEDELKRQRAHLGGIDAAISINEANATRAEVRLL